MSIVVLGPVSVNGASLGPRDRVVLAALAMRIGEAVSADRLADALWGERPPASWAKVVQGCVMRLRKVLGARAIETLPDGYRLAVPMDEVDAQRFERLVRRGQELLALSEPERAAHALDEALGLWQGRALAELQQWDPGRIEAERLEQLRLDAQEAQLDAALQAGLHRDVLGGAQTRVAEAPFRERRWALLALAQYQAGRQADALRTLHRARRMLDDELGLDPGPDLVALEAAILRQDPSLAASTALPEPSASCPYLGLMAYRVADADAFFGRDADVTACLTKLLDRGVLAVVGPSGCGKSSLIRAGVAASLEREGRRVVIITPGAHAMDALTAVPSSGPPPVLVVDQCEEAITLCDDPEERARFFDALTAHAEHAPLAIALRADRLGEVSTYPSFARMLERGMYLLGAMDEADLRAAVEGPARQAGLLLEPGLVDVLVREVEGEPGALPLLSHALRKTWERREGRTLAVAGYRDSGGIRDAVAQSAEELYERISTAQRSMLRDLLLRLVVADPEGEPVRNRVPRRMLAADEPYERLIELLVDARLVTSDDGVVELAHEALTRAWPRLRSWLDEDVEGQRILRHLTLTAGTWDAMGRPASELYRGVRRTKALEWLRRARPDLTPLERAFLHASDELAETEGQAAEARVAAVWLRELLSYETLVNRRVRVLLSGIGLTLLVIATILAVVAVRQSRRAEREVRVIEARSLASASVTNLEADPDRSILLALEAVEATRQDGIVLPEAEEAVHRAIQRSRLMRTVPQGNGLAVSPDGRRFATTGDGDAVVWETASARRVLTLRHETGFNNIAMSPDGRRIATTHRDGTAGIWDASSGRRLHLLEAHERWAASPQFSPDSRTVVTTGGDGTVRLWDARTGAERLTMRDRRGPTSSPRFSPDGSRLIVANGDSTARIWNVATGEPETLLEGPQGVVRHAVYSPDGTRVATASDDGAVRIADAASGEVLLRLFGRNAIRCVEYSADGRWIAAGGDDGVAVMWDARTGRQQLTLPGHPAGIVNVAFTPDGRRLVTSGTDPSARVWDVSVGGGRDWLTVTAPRHRLAGVTFSPDGTAFAAPGGGGVVLRDPASGRRLRTLSGAGPVQNVVFSPDGTRVAGTVQAGLTADAATDAAGDAGAVPIWDVRTGELMTAMRDVGDLGTNVVFSPDGRLVATGAFVGEGEQSTVTIWDATSGVQRRAFDVDHLVTQVGWSPDGRVLVTGGGQGQLTMWDVTTSRRLLSLPTHGEYVSSMVFTPDGRLVTGSYDGTVGIWDVETGQRLRTLRAHVAGVAGVAVSSDGNRLATASDDSTVKVWDAHTGRLQLTLHGHEAGVSGVAFSPDGRLLASASPDGTVRLHVLPLDELLALARARVTRRLTDAECRQYLQQPRCARR